MAVAAVAAVVAAGPASASPITDDTSNTTDSAEHRGLDYIDDALGTGVHAGVIVRAHRTDGR